MALAAALVCLVVGITDGDTLKARCGEPGNYQQVTVRLAAVDAPERRQAFGNASRQHLAALCFQQRAQIAPRTTDRYGRLVADVACQGQDAGGELVRSGMAWVYKRYAAKRDAPLSRLEAQARAARAGLWADPAPVAPWEWRRSQRNSPRM
ncbi:thermonuclease family protein [Acidovorax sp. SUPP1855]|uniref:thermonuclease family protein n=1 Tax=Acidovorax sp. SUPP1855 TaxID=431774 RepID=UPI0032E9E08E